MHKTRCDDQCWLDYQKFRFRSKTRNLPNAEPEFSSQSFLRFFLADRPTPARLCLHRCSKCLQISQTFGFIMLMRRTPNRANLKPGSAASSSTLYLPCRRRAALASPATLQVLSGRSPADGALSCTRFTFTAIFLSTNRATSLEPQLTCRTSPEVCPAA